MIQRLFLFLSIIFIPVIVFSQSVDEAKTHMYHHRWSSAEEVLQKVIAENKNNVDAYYWLGELYMQEKKAASAKDVFQKGYEQAVNNKLSKKEYPLIYTGLAHWKLSQGMKEEAAKELEEVLGATKYKNSTALLAAARAHLTTGQGDAKKAIEYLEKAINRDKKNPALYIAMGDAYRKLLDGANAVSAYRDALEFKSLNAEAYYKLGKIYKTQKNDEIYLDRFTKAVEADANYAPALYELYNYYFYNNDVVKAKTYMDEYFENADPSPKHAYMTADYLYLSENNAKAIAQAEKIIERDGKDVQPRLYKMIAYCNEKLGDSATALDFVNKYFEAEKPENYVMKDYELRAKLLETVTGKKEEAASMYEKAVAMAEKDEVKLAYMESIINLYSEMKNSGKEAIWREKFYTAKENPTNLDLYYWGIALYTSETYKKADSVFSIYEEKYPDQVFGYLWRARANAQIDSAMEKGSAVPHYQKLIEVAEKDAEKNVSNLVGAYGYIGAYKANVEKDFSGSLECFNRILELDENNNDAMRYSEILQQWIDKTKTAEEESDEQKEGGSSSINR